MEIGISTACFYPACTEDTLFGISEAGAGLCEVFLEAEYEYDPEFTGLLRERMSGAGIRANSVHAFCATFEHQLFSDYERRRRDGLKVFEKVVKAAVALGAASYTFHGDIKSADITKVDMKHYKRCMDELINISAGYGVNLAWENVAWCQSSRPEFIGMVREAVEGLKFTLDIKQARRAGIDIDEYIKVMGSDIVNVHINDYNDTETCLLPGRGSVDFPSFFGRLREAGYSGNAIIEVYSSNYETADELAAALEYAKNCAAADNTTNA